MKGYLPSVDGAEGRHDLTRAGYADLEFSAGYG